MVVLYFLFFQIERFNIQNPYNFCSLDIERSKSFYKNMKAPRKLTLGFAEIGLYENYVVSSINEGVVLDENHLAELFEIFDSYYKDRPFVSIANREHDYTIDPNLLRDNKHPFLLGIAVICYNESSMEIANFEKKFYSGKYEIFGTIEDAVEWANELIKNYIKKAGL